MWGRLILIWIWFPVIFFYKIIVFQWDYDLLKSEHSLVIFHFFKQNNPLKITLQNFEIDKKYLQDLNLKQSYISQLNLIQFCFLNIWIWLLFVFQFWNLKNIFYSKVWHWFNINFHSWMWSNFFFKHLKLIVICFSILAFQKYFLFKIL